MQTRTLLPATALIAAALSLADPVASRTEPLEVEIRPLCIPVPSQLKASLSPTITGEPRAVRSQDWWRVWFVSARIASGRIATWATDDIYGNGRIWVIDGNARTHSSWPPAPGLSFATHGAALSRNCLS